MCKLRIAVNTRKKDRETNQWSDHPNYFDVTVWGAQGENVAKYLQKGSPLLIDGRLEWREWQAQDGTNRQSVEIIAENTQFIGGRDGGQRRRRRWERVRSRARPRSAVRSGRRRRRHSVLGPP